MASSSSIYPLLLNNLPPHVLNPRVEDTIIVQRDGYLAARHRIMFNAGGRWVPLAQNGKIVGLESHHTNGTSPLYQAIFDLPFGGRVVNETGLPVEEKHWVVCDDWRAMLFVVEAANHHTHVHARRNYRVADAVLEATGLIRADRLLALPGFAEMRNLIEHSRRNLITVEASPENDRRQDAWDLMVADVLRDVYGPHLFRDVRLPTVRPACPHCGKEHWNAITVDKMVCRECFKRFDWRIVWLKPPCLEWQHGRLKETARAMRDAPAFDPLCLLPLADLAEEAGLPDDHDVITHLRAAGPHCRGCWALALLCGD